MFKELSHKRKMCFKTLGDKIGIYLLEGLLKLHGYSLTLTGNK